MRKKLIIIGIIVLIIGIILFAYGNNHYNYYNEKQVDTSFIEIPNTINIEDFENEMDYGRNVSNIGIIGLVISVILIAIGLILKEN